MGKHLPARQHVSGINTRLISKHLHLSPVFAKSGDGKTWPKISRFLKEMTLVPPHCSFCSTEDSSLVWLRLSHHRLNLSGATTDKRQPASVWARPLLSTPSFMHSVYHAAQQFVVVVRNTPRVSWSIRVARGRVNRRRRHQKITDVHGLHFHVAFWEATFSLQKGTHDGISFHLVTALQHFAACN